MAYNVPRTKKSGRQAPYRVENKLLQKSSENESYSVKKTSEKGGEASAAFDSKTGNLSVKGKAFFTDKEEITEEK